jgi:hypothetical protein
MRSNSRPPCQSAAFQRTGAADLSGAAQGGAGEGVLAGGGAMRLHSTTAPALCARKIQRIHLDDRYRAWQYRDKGSLGEKLTQEIL